MKKLILLCLAITATTFAQSTKPLQAPNGVQTGNIIPYTSGKIGINTATPEAALDVSSTIGGFLPPRMTTTQRNAIPSPTMFTQIANITTGRFEWYDGSTWQSLVTVPNLAAVTAAGYDTTSPILVGTFSGTSASLMPNGTFQSFDPFVGGSKMTTTGFYHSGGLGSVNHLYSNLIANYTEEAAALPAGTYTPVYSVGGVYADVNGDVPAAAGSLNWQQMFDTHGPIEISSGDNVFYGAPGYLFLIDANGTLSATGSSIQIVTPTHQVELGSNNLVGIGEIGGGGAYLGTEGRVELANGVSSVRIQSDNITAPRMHQTPNGSGTYGLSVRFNGTSYPFGTNGETGNIALSVPVTSVNAQTGAVVLNHDNIGDGTTYKAYSATDKLKLAGIAAGATANQTDAYLLNRDNHTDGATNKAYTATEKSKLAGIATGATANDTDANLKARANHTGTQTASTISDFATAAQTAVVQNNITTATTTKSPSVDAVTAMRSFHHRFHGSSTNWADNTSYYYSGSNNVQPLTNTGRYVYAGMDATKVRASIYLYPSTGLGSSESATVVLKNATTGNSVTLTSGLLANTASNGLATSLQSLSITANDALEVIVTTPNYATNPLGCLLIVEVELFNY